MFRVQGFPTLVLVKNNQVFKFKGPRDEATLKRFISTDYSKFESTSVPTELPTFMENLKEALAQSVEVVGHIYSSDNTMAKVILSFLFGVVFVLVLAICYFSCCEKPAPSRLSKRNSSRNSSSAGSNRNSTSGQESRRTSGGTEGEGVKRRSTARRRE